MQCEVVNRAWALQFYTLAHTCLIYFISFMATTVICLSCLTTLFEERAEGEGRDEGKHEGRQEGGKEGRLICFSPKCCENRSK